MGVKKLLAKQDAGFISLHDLLLKMTQAGDGCTLQEAATVLFRLLDSSEHPDRPRWLIKGKVEGLREASEGFNFSGTRCVRYAATHGKFEPDADWDWKWNEEPFRVEAPLKVRANDLPF